MNLSTKQIEIINEWCRNARKLGYTKRDAKKKIKGYPRIVRKQILRTLKEYEKAGYLTLKESYLTEKNPNELESEGEIAKTFRLGGKFYLKTGNLIKTFRLMKKRIDRMEDGE